MSAQGDLRKRLEVIADMMPLTERERRLAEWILYGDGQTNMADHVRAEPEWWGERATKAVDYLEPQCQPTK
jgi:hypothetical protein